MNARQRFDQFLTGQSFTDGVPAAFFQHFRPDQRHGQAALNAQLDFLRRTDMDMLKLMFDDIYPPIPHIQHASDWDHLPAFTQNDPVFTNQIELAVRVVDQVGSSTPVFQTIFSPFVSAGCAASSMALWDIAVTPHFLEEPQAMTRALTNIADVLGEFAHRIARTGIDGFYVSLQGGESSRYPQEFFRQWLKPLDLLLLKALQETGKILFLHICGTGMRLEDYYDYPGDIVNLAVHGNSITLAGAQQAFGRRIMGGLNNNGTIINGSRAEIEADVTSTLLAAPEGVMLGADCTIPAQVPVEHLAWAVSAAHSFRRK